MSSPFGPTVKRKNTATTGSGASPAPGVGGGTSGYDSSASASGGPPAASFMVGGGAGVPGGLNSTPTSNSNPFGSSLKKRNSLTTGSGTGSTTPPPVAGGVGGGATPFGSSLKKSRNNNNTTTGTGSTTPPPVDGGATTAGGLAGGSIPDPRADMTINDQVVETTKVKWAWSMDPTHPSMSPDGRSLMGHSQGPLTAQMEDSSVKNDLMDVVRLISTATISTQTMEPSYTMTLGNVKMVDSGEGRSIAVQAGTQLQRTTSGMQVVEADLAADGQTKRDAFGDPLNDEPLLSVGPVSSMHSAYLPTCNVPSSMYPVFMNDARALGISNRYGYIALPKPPVELPPRRRVKAVNPTQYAHLYGSHNPQLDEHTDRQLHRAHGLWSSQCGFAPKY